MGGQKTKSDHHTRPFFHVRPSTEIFSGGRVNFFKEKAQLPTAPIINQKKQK